MKVAKWSMMLLVCLFQCWQKIHARQATEAVGVGPALNPPLRSPFLSAGKVVSQTVKIEYSIPFIGL